jgi:hypothetical protein
MVATMAVHTKSAVVRQLYPRRARKLDLWVIVLSGRRTVRIHPHLFVDRKTALEAAVLARYAGWHTRTLKCWAKPTHDHQAIWAVITYDRTARMVCRSLFTDHDEALEVAAHSRYAGRYHARVFRRLLP